VRLVFRTFLTHAGIFSRRRENQPEVGWLGGWLYPQPTRVQTLGLTSVCLIKAEYSFSGRRRSRR
jgi:hypothetical protein